MLDPFYAGIYWGARQEAHEACADRLTTALRELAYLDIQFLHWYRKVRSRKNTFPPEVPVERDTIDRLLTSGVNRTDIGNKPIPQLGFSLGLWNGYPDNRAMSLFTTCGAYSPVVKNVVVVDLPCGGEEASALLDFQHLSHTLMIMVQNFAPDWGTVNTARLQNSVLNLPKDMPQVGWLTYLSQAFGEVPPCPDYELITIDGLGTLIVTTREVFSVDDPKHVRSAMAAAEAVSRLVKLAPANPPAIPGTQG
jgi:hypothetical protein